MNSTKNTQASRDAKIASLKAQLEKLQSEEQVKEVQAPVIEENYEKTKLDDMIPVMSLLPYTLNLSTKEQGQGSTKKFTRFGEIKQILYKDLIDILDNHANFLEAGFFYILSPAVIKQHGLGDVYSKILTKEKMDELLSLKTEECLSIYSSANDKQKEILIELVIDKVRDNPESINLNLVDRLSRLSKVEIVKRAEDEREIRVITSEKE